MYFGLADYEVVQGEVLRCGHAALPRLQLLGQWGAVPATTLAALRCLHLSGFFSRQTLIEAA